MSTGLLTLDVVNDLDRSEFVAAFGEILEASPHLAADAWAARPFAAPDELVAAFAAAVDALDEAAAVALLRAHPVLGASGPMAASSVSEQSGAGLVDLAEERRARLAADNAAYLDRFGFPFILAVSGLTATDIDASIARRLDHTPEVELATAIDEVKKIAAIRIAKLVEA